MKTILILLLFLISFKSYSQIGCITSEICNYESLFKEIEIHSTYIYCSTADSTILFFNMVDDICNQLTVFSKSDRFLFDIILKINCNNTIPFDSKLVYSSNLLIYTFKQINYEKSTSQNNY